MNAKRSNTLKMGHAVSGALETITSTNDVPALRAKHVALKTLLDRINATSAAQAAPVTGQTRARNKAFASAVDAGTVVAGAVLSYAQELGLDALIARVEITRSQLQTGRLARRLELLQQIHAAATSVLTELADYRITAAVLTDLQAKIDAASTLLVAPRASIVSRRVATARLEADFRRLRRLLTEQIDPLIETLRLATPDDYARYQAARVTVDLPGSSPQSTAPDQVVAPAGTSTSAAPLAAAA